MEFVEIFTNMGWLPIILLTIGMVFIVVEMFIPGFGFFGVTGLICTLVGVIVRIIEGLSFAQALTLILILIGLYIMAIMAMIFSGRFGIIGATGLFENKATLPEDYSKVNKELRKLVGRSGKAVGVLNLGGKAKINGKIYDVVSINSYIESGTNVKVVAIKNNTIMVRRWFE